MKILLLVVIVATACAAPQSIGSPQSRDKTNNKPCVIGFSKTHSVISKSDISTEEFTPPDTVPTNHYYFSSLPDKVEYEPQVYRNVPDEIRYNIVFVKVPPFIPKVQETIYLPAKTDEKTTVYVLVKKPDDPQTIVLPEQPEPVDEKPEVIIVKYNEDKDIQAEIEGVDQSKIFGDLGLARTSQISEAQVNRDLTKLKKVDITQLQLVGDTIRTSVGGQRHDGEQQPTRTSGSRNEQTGGPTAAAAVADYGDNDDDEDVNQPTGTTNAKNPSTGESSGDGGEEEDEDDYGDGDETDPSTKTQTPSRTNRNQETDDQKKKEDYAEKTFRQNNLKNAKKNQ